MPQLDSRALSVLGVCVWGWQLCQFAGVRRRARSLSAALRRKAREEGERREGGAGGGVAAGRCVPPPRRPAEQCAVSLNSSWRGDRERFEGATKKEPHERERWKLREGGEGAR